MTKPPPHYGANANNARNNAVRDISIYRTPSGQFYCGTCDLTVVSENLMLQHLDSKKHIKTLKHPNSH
jgi:Zinc-finger double-stranded RNA-binding